MAFKMKGHTLPGIKQKTKSDKATDGRAKSSAFQSDKYAGKTRAEVIAMVRANNQGKKASDGTRQSVNHELKLWKLENRDTAAEDTATKTNE